MVIKNVKIMKDKDIEKSSIFFQERRFDVIESVKEIQNQLQSGNIKPIVLHFKDYPGDGTYNLNKIFLPKYSFVFCEKITSNVLDDDF